MAGLFRVRVRDPSVPFFYAHVLPSYSRVAFQQSGCTIMPGGWNRPVCGRRNGHPFWQSGSNLGTRCLSFCSALLHVHKLIVTDVSKHRARFLYRFLCRKLLPAMCVPPSSILYDLYWMFVHGSGPAWLLSRMWRSRDPCDPPKPMLAVTFGESPVFQGAKDLSFFFFFFLLPARSEVKRALESHSANTKAQYYCGIWVAFVWAKLVHVSRVCASVPAGWREVKKKSFF